MIKARLRQGFIIIAMRLGEAAPLRQSSRVPRLSTYPRACVPGYSLQPSPLVEPALVAQIDYFLNEDRLLLVIQTRK